VILAVLASLLVLLLLGCLVPWRRRVRRRLKKLELQMLEEALAADDWETLEKFRQGKSRWMTKAQVDKHLKRLKSRLSEQAGLSVAYLLSQEFTALARRRSGKEDPTFYDLRDAFFFGEDPIGADVPCPRDGDPGCAFVDTLSAKHRGRSTHFLSWTWGYRLSVVQDALRYWLKSVELQADHVFLYMCFFVNNQYRILVNNDQNGSDDLANVFEENLIRIGRVLALLDTWDGPRYLTRIWTIFEQVIAMKLELPVTIILPSAESESFMRQLEFGKEGILRVKEALTKVDSKQAQASCQQDEDAVKELIKTTFPGGFDFVDRQIVKFMVHWMGSATESTLNALINADTRPLLGRIKSHLHHPSRVSLSSDGDDDDDGVVLFLTGSCRGRDDDDDNKITEDSVAKRLKGLYDDEDNVETEDASATRLGLVQALDVNNATL